MHEGHWLERPARWLLISLLSMALSCADRMLRQVDELFRPYSGEVPGAAVMVIRHGRPIMTRY